MTYLQKLPKPFFVLAPMDDVTDTVFRQVIHEISPAGLYFTEFVNVDGLQSLGRKKLIHKLSLGKNEKNTIAQIWGLKPENFAKTANELVEMGFAGVDLNFGCPQKSEVKSGACAALINNKPLSKEIIEAAKEGIAGRVPLSVKTRLGYNDIDFSWHEFLLGLDLDMLTIHGRTKREMSKVQAHWDEIGIVREMRDKLSPKTLIVGNGDVRSKQEGYELAKKYSLDGIMVGRGIFQDPYLFSGEDIWQNKMPKQKISLYKKHAELFAETYKNNEKPVYVLNKFCKTYINGFDGAKEIREKLMRSKDLEELLYNLKSIKEA